MQSTNPHNQGLNVSLEYAAGVLEFLESFTREKLKDEESKHWMARLTKYPKWKLVKLDNYTGRLNNGVFQFLDELKIPDGFIIGHDGLPQKPVLKL